MSEPMRTTMCLSCTTSRPPSEMRIIGTRKGANGGVIRIFRCVWCIARQKKPKRVLA